MQIEVVGRKYLDKLIDTIASELKKTNNYDALDKLSTSILFLDEFCKDVSKHFIACSDWRIMRDEDLTKSTACAISFTNDMNPDVEYSPDNMPEDSITILYCPEEAYFEVFIGNDTIFIISFEKGHKCRCKCAALYKNKNNEMYTMVLDSIMAACNAINKKYS